MNTNHTDSVEAIVDKMLAIGWDSKMKKHDGTSIVVSFTKAELCDLLLNIQANHQQQVEEIEEEAWAASKLLWDRMTEWNKEWQTQNPNNELTHKDAMFLIEWKMKQQVEEAVEAEKKRILDELWRLVEWHSQEKNQMFGLVSANTTINALHQARGIVRGDNHASTSNTPNHQD